MIDSPDPILLYCFPYAGGSASLFRSWDECAPSGLKVCPVELPGRGLRAREALIADYATLVERLTADVQRALEHESSGGRRPRFAMFGHSAGARFCFAVASRLMSLTRHRPLCCFLAGACPPHRVALERKRGDLSDRELVEELRVLGGTQQQVLKEPTLIQYLLPIFRADFRASEASGLDQGRRLDVPLTLFAAARDHLVDSETVWEWERYTRAGCQKVLMTGDHFSIVQSPKPLIRRIAELLNVTESRSPGWATALT